MKAFKSLCLVWVGGFLVATGFGFGSLAHLEIAGRAFPGEPDVLNRDYGAVAPDLALYVADPARWPSAFEDTHYRFIDLRRYAVSASQRSFALGWMSHNEVWGADYVAHTAFDQGPGYVTQKASLLAFQAGIDEEIAHYAVETAVDLLLKRSRPLLAQRLLEAGLYRSWQDRTLLSWVLVWRHRQTDWGTLTSTELGFRYLVVGYALALTQPESQDIQALSALAVQLGDTWFGAPVDQGQVMEILEAAMDLCEEDYELALDAAVQSVLDNLP
jgi:hypothetical protein